MTRCSFNQYEKTCHNLFLLLTHDLQSPYLEWNVVHGEFLQHVVSKSVDDALASLSAAAAGVLGLDADYGVQHGVGGVGLVSGYYTQSLHN